MVTESSVARLGPPNDHYLILNTSSTYFIEHRSLMRQVHCHQPQCITNLYIHYSTSFYTLIRSHQIITYILLMPLKHKILICN
jgi:hypothetical protein